MSDSTVAAPYTGGRRHDGVNIQSPPRWRGGDRASPTKDPRAPRCALLSFQRPPCVSGGSRRLASALPRSQKRPLVVRGPISAGPVGRSWTPRYEAAPLVNRGKSDRGV